MDKNGCKKWPTPLTSTVTFCHNDTKCFCQVWQIWIQTSWNIHAVKIQPLYFKVNTIKSRRSKARRRSKAGCKVQWKVQESSPVILVYNSVLLTMLHGLTFWTLGKSSGNPGSHVISTTDHICAYEWTISHLISVCIHVCMCMYIRIYLYFCMSRSPSHGPEFIALGVPNYLKPKYKRPQTDIADSLGRPMR